MEISKLTPSDHLWSDLIAHLHRADDARWVLNEVDQPLPNLHFLAAVGEAAVVGSLSLKQQPIIIPAAEWSGGEPRWLIDPAGQPLQEMFVQTFSVDEGWRRRGVGTALQQAALALTREQGCYQLRSWSSLDRPANYALKVKLGFAAHPAVFTTDAGLEVSGVYFVKTV